MTATGPTAFELGTDGPLRILAGVDGTDSSMRAGAYAAGMARRHGATLIVVHVAATSALAAQTAGGAGALVETQAQLRNELRDLVVEQAHRLGIRAEFVFRSGNPYRELFDVAQSRKVDAVVIGGSTKSGRRFVGSMAARLVRDAVWPITVVP